MADRSSEICFRQTLAGRIGRAAAMLATGAVLLCALSGCGGYPMTVESRSVAGMPPDQPPMQNQIDAAVQKQHLEDNHHN